MTSVSTICGKFDNTCLLHPGDHDFIKHESYISYSFCRIEPADKLINGVKVGQFIDKGLLNDKVFQKVIDGLYMSPFTKPFAIEAIQAYKKQALSN